MNAIAPAAADLDDRIAGAFRDGPTSNDVATLITEVEAASLASSETADRARTRALDPALSTKQVAEARRAMEDAAFARDRLSAAVPRLQERLKELRAAEENARRWAAYRKTEAERDKLAAELADVYPPFAERLAELLPRIDANDRQIEQINDHALPSGAKRLLVAELVARGLPAFNPEPYVNVPRITHELRLPAFEYPGERYVWPRRLDYSILTGAPWGQNS